MSDVKTKADLREFAWIERCTPLKMDVARLYTEYLSGRKGSEDYFMKEFARTLPDDFIPFAFHRRPFGFTFIDKKSLKKFRLSITQYDSWVEMVK